MSDRCILAVETATDACSAALFINGEIRQLLELAPRQHVALIMPFIDELLAESGIRPQALDAVAFGRGPGSFTGLRIAAGIAQGIAYGADVPVVPVSTLAALAQATVTQYQADAVLAALDARMQEVYWGTFVTGAAGLVELEGEERVCSPEAVSCLRRDDWVAAGEGWSSYRDALVNSLGFEPGRCDENLRPQAAGVARLAAAAFERGEAIAPELAIPVYLRDRVANKPKTGA